MNRKTFISNLVLVASLAGVSDLQALANRVFVSARSGSDLNSCDNINTPCQTFAGAVVQLNAGGEAIVLDTGGYGPVTITKSLTIEAPPGVLAFVHPPSGDAITVSAGASDTVILRGLVLNGGSGSGILVSAVGTLTVQNCAITGFAIDGLRMEAPGKLIVKNTSVKHSSVGIRIANTTGAVIASIDQCHLNDNTAGFRSSTASPGGSTTTATNTTANNNAVDGWDSGENTGLDILNLEFCSGSENGVEGIRGNSSNASSVVRYSNSVFSNNGTYGVSRVNNGTFETRVSNTITGNGTAATNGAIGVFSAQ